MLRFRAAGYTNSSRLLKFIRREQLRALYRVRAIVSALSWVDTLRGRFALARRELTAVNRKIGDMDMLIAANVLRAAARSLRITKKISKI